MHGAGGMQLIDPLFQRELVLAAKRKGIPVIFDEVFVGSYRLGPPTTIGWLGVCYRCHKSAARFADTDVPRLRLALGLQQGDAGYCDVRQADLGRPSAAGTHAHYGG